MNKQKLGRRILSLLLVFALSLGVIPTTAFAAKGALENVSTGLTGNIDTSDTISLPISILDYEADGMLFEFSENASEKSVYDFGASVARDYTKLTAAPNTNKYVYNSWGAVTSTLKTGTYANYTRLTYAKAAKNLSEVAVSWNNDNRAGVILPNDLNKDEGTGENEKTISVSIDNARYLVLVYRSNVTSGKIEFLVETTDKDRYKTTAIAGDYTFTSEGATNWTYAVYDLKAGTGALKNNWSGNVKAIWTTLPIDASGEYIDIAHAALFKDADQAKAFGEYALTDGSNRGANRGFGLLRGSLNQGGGSAFTGIFEYNNTDADYGNAKATITQVNTYDSEISEKKADEITNLGYKLLGVYGDNAIANVGLLESTLGENGYPVYKEEVVTYMAYLLKHSLEIPERNSDGWKNYRYIEGTASSVYGGTDLATALRSAIDNKTIDKGQYAAAAGKNLVGEWSKVSGNISTYYDAAYFLLNSIFYAGSYNVPQDDYNYLVLSAGTDKKTGDKVYVFDGGFADSANTSTAKSAVKYDTAQQTIQNNSAAGKAHFYYGDTSTTTLYPFLPVTDRNTASGMTKSLYYQDSGIINGVKKQTGQDTVYKRNYNFAMVSEGEFVYHADDELFFEFEGDDDVYLFINGELVMDIGSAHSIDKIRFELNDYVNAAKAGTLGSPERNKSLALEEGGTYAFKFYYMERHTYGSNMRVCTNIRVTDPSMTTEKTAWQDGTQLDFGSIVDQDKVVEYGFAVTNNGETNLFNLTFTDTDIGVTLDPTNGLKVTGSVTDVNGGTLDASDLTAVVSHPNYDDIEVTFANNEALKLFLKELTADGTQAGSGLFIGATVQIRGIGYKLSTTQINAGVFDNTVLTTSTNQTGSQTLRGQASMRVFVPADPMYYQWADHKLSITKAKLINDILAASKTEGNILANKVPNLSADGANVNKIELVTKAGTAISSPYVTIDGSYNLTVNYDTTGSKVFYAKVTYNSSKNTVIVPVLVNVTDVQNSVYVLDYGLDVVLTENNKKGVNELLKNDTLTVPGRNTTSTLLGIGSNGAYTPNEITFTKDADGTVNAAYGDFVLNGQTMRFEPTKFLEGSSTTQVAVNVYENSITPSQITGTLNINKEVEMFKSVTTVPANVVYYEDDFPAITYTTTETNASYKNTIEKVGTSEDKTQSADQNEQYGHDDYYAGNTADNTFTDKYSGNSLTKITINQSGVAASFTFVGTGFELISRTNATDSASLSIRLYDTKLDEDGVTIVKNNRLKTIPVITEFDNNDDGGNEGIYQVPVIRVNDLEPKQYIVEISGTPARDYDNWNGEGTPAIIPTILYVDGLRIFQPVEGKPEEDHYLDTEKDAQFLELRDQILAGQIAVAQYTETNGLVVSTATSTWTENLNGESEGISGLEFNQVTSIDEYLMKGPNNEVYMTGTYDNAALVFYVKEIKETKEIKDVPHSLQIALRGMDETLFMSGIESGVDAAVRVGVYANDTYGWAEVDADITSSTEQYYVIDYTKCFYDKDKEAYQVVIRVDEGLVSYSSLKLTGLKLVSVEGEHTDLYYVNGILSAFLTEENPGNPDEGDENLPDHFSLRTTTTSDSDEDEYGAVDAAAYVNFRSVKQQMRSTLLISDQEEEDTTEPTEPETTEPTEPETTEPTEPETTEPTEPETTEPTEPETTEPTEPETTEPTEPETTEPTEPETTEPTEPETTEPTEPETTKPTEPETTKPGKEEATKPTTKPGKEEATKPTTKPGKEEATKPTTKPGKEEATKPTTKPGKEEATKPTTSKPGKDEATKPVETKPSQEEATKPVETKPGKEETAKPGDNKPNKEEESKPADTKPGKDEESKPGDTKPGQEEESKPGKIKSFFIAVIDFLKGLFGF